jgi:hypothetical protein
MENLTMFDLILIIILPLAIAVGGAYWMTDGFTNL